MLFLITWRTGGKKILVFRFLSKNCRGYCKTTNFSTMMFRKQSVLVLWNQPWKQQRNIGYFSGPDPLARTAASDSWHSDCLRVRKFHWHRRSHLDRFYGVGRQAGPEPPDIFGQVNHLKDAHSNCRSKNKERENFCSYGAYRSSISKDSNKTKGSRKLGGSKVTRWNGIVCSLFLQASDGLYLNNRGHMQTWLRRALCENATTVGDWHCIVHRKQIKPQ